MGRWQRGLAGAMGALLAVGLANAVPAGADAATGSPTKARLGQPATYVLDFVATAASGIDMNDAGDIVGTSYPDPGCGSSCLPPLDTVVWRAGQRIVLPGVPFSSDIFPVDINNNGWITGSAGIPGTTTHAVVWKPKGNTYTAIDLGTLPGQTSSIASGIDDLNRVVGWSAAPFMWTKAGGMVNLTTLGFPSEQPLAISSGGTVGTMTSWYRLDDPNSVVSLPPPPQGFVIGAGGFAINDAGDQARFLGIPFPEFLDYPFRFHHEGAGTWQQLSSIPTGHLSSAGVGSINDAGDITVTVQSAGMIAYGPDGLAQPFAPLVSPAYGGSAVTTLGTMNASGQILTQMIIGQTGRRLVRAVPGTPCTSNCIRVTSLLMKGKGPGFCNEGRAQATASLIVTNEAGAVLPGVSITGHFFDDYWLDELVSGTTNSQGKVTFNHQGPPCVGGIAFLVTDAEKSGRIFDRTTGILTKYVLPLP